MNKFKNIIRLESIIEDFYFKLIEIELFSDKNDEEFTKTIEMLKMAISDETKLFSTLTSSDIKHFMELLQKSKGIDSFIISRLLERFNNDFRNVRIISFFNKPNKEAKNITFSIVEKQNKFFDILMMERMNIKLSFFDEEIEKEKDLHIKKKLLVSKYMSLFTSDYKTENEIIERSFSTDKSLFLCAEGLAFLIGIDYKLFREVEFNISTRSLNNDISTIIESFSKNRMKIENFREKSISFLLEVRTLFLLLDENEYKGVFENLFLGNELLTKIIDINELYENIIKDRERHKRVSLVKRK